MLLLIASAISAALWLFERDAALPYEAMAIFAVVLLNAVMGYIQQARAEQAVAALRQMSAAHATVIRDGVRRRIAAAELVPEWLTTVRLPSDSWSTRTVATRWARSFAGRQKAAYVLDRRSTSRPWRIAPVTASPSTSRQAPATEPTPGSAASPERR